MLQLYSTKLPLQKRKLSGKEVEAEEDYTKFNSDSKEKKVSFHT